MAIAKHMSKTHLSNAARMNMNTEIYDCILSVTVEALRLESLAPGYKTCIDREGEGVNRITKSAPTAIRQRKLGVWLLSIIMLTIIPQMKAENTVTYDNWSVYGQNANVSSTDAEELDIYKNENTYTIKTARGLAWIAYITNNQKIYNQNNSPFAPGKTGFEGCKVILEKDLDLSGSGLSITDANWIPIGKTADITFLGTFDGKGKTVSGMNITSQTADATTLNMGLFGTASGIIQNLVVKGAINLENKTGYLYAAGIAASLSNGIIRNCISHVAINIDNAKYMNVGGIAGRHQAANGKPGYATDKSYTITNCYSTGNIKATGSANNNIYVGGIAGYGDMPVSNCYSTVSIAAGMKSGEEPGNFYIGGIIGDCFATPSVSNCFALNTGGITAIRRFRIFGRENSSAKLSNNFASGCIRGNQSYKTSYQADGKSIFLDDASQTLTSWANEAFSTSDSNLPKLKMINEDENTYGDAIPGQPDYAITDYFKKPANWSEYGETADIGTTGKDVTINDNSYTVKTAKGLAWIAWVTNDILVKKANISESNLFPDSQNFGKCTVTLNESISLSKPDDVDSGFDTNWIPIGLGDWLKAGVGSGLQNVFRGTFNGNGKTISNMTITPNPATTYNSVGLFGELTTGSIINVRVTGNIKVSSAKSINAGGIVGKLHTSNPVSNCISEVHVEATSTGDVSKEDIGVYAGGITGNITGTDNKLINCYATGDITSSSTNTATGSTDNPWQNVNAGGIVGGNHSGNSNTISKCFATGAITATGTNAYKVNAGGIIGYADQKVESCLALNKSITLNVTSPVYFGRMVGSKNYYCKMTEGYASTKIAGTWKNKSKTDKDGADFYQEDNLEALFGSDGWSYTNENLPTLTAITDQPALTKNAYLESRADIPLTLPSNGSTNVITLKCKEGKWTYQIGENAELPFNGTVSKALGTTTPANQLLIASTTGSTPATLTLDNVTIFKTDANPVIKISADATVEIKTNGDCNLMNTSSEASTIYNEGKLTIASNDDKRLYVTGNTYPTIFKAEGATLGNSWLEWAWEKTSSSTYYNFFKDGEMIIESMTPSRKVYAIIATSGDYTITNKNFAQKAYNAEGIPVMTFTPEEGKVVSFTNVSAGGTVAITNEKTYSTVYKDLPIIVKNGGIFNVNTDDASIYSLTIEPGGQVKQTKPLKIVHDFTCKRILDNKWSTFATPVEMAASVESTVIYTASGFQETNTGKQVWENISGTSGTSSANLDNDKPYLIASEEANTMVNFKATGTTIPAAQIITLNESLDNGIFLFTANNTLQRQSLSNIYVLNSEKNCFELKTASTIIEPMEAFVVANAVTRSTIKSLAISKGISTGNERPALSSDTRIWGGNGLLNISSDVPTDIRIINAAGRLLRHIKADAGDTQVSLPSGIYFIHCNNITYKIKL